MAAPPPLYCFRAVSGHTSPFVSDWDDLPKDVFRTRDEAAATARDFVSRYQAGGHDPHYDWWWVRDAIADTSSRYAGMTIDGVQPEATLYRLMYFEIAPVAS